MLFGTFCDYLTSLFFTADAYLLQLQKYELPPTPAATPAKAAFLSTGSGSPLGAKTPASATTPPKVAVKASPATSPSVTPTKQLGMATQKVVMQSPLQSAKPKAQPMASPAKAVTQKQTPAASPVPAVASSVMSTGTSVTQTSTAAASTAVSGIKTVVQGQLVNQGQAASAGSITGQGLALIRAPVQLPPGVQATMITNAQGIPVMRLQGAGIQGTAPVTIVTTQVGATQLQGATIVRMAAPVGNSASSGTTTGTVLRLPVQSGTSNVPGTAVLKIPVTTSIQLPGATGLTMTAIAGSSGQAVIRQQLPVTLPANLPPGTQLKVGPQGQLTAIGPGGNPVQLTLQNVKTQQLATGLQVQSGATIGTPTVVQLAGASMKANIAQLTTSSSAPAKVTQATQSLVTSTKPAVTLTVASVAKTVMTTASVTPSSAVVAGQNTLFKKQIPPSAAVSPATAQGISGQGQKTSATAVSTSGQPVKTTMPSKQTTVVTTLTTKQPTKTMVTGTIGTSGAASVTTVLPSKVNPPATSTAKASVPQATAMSVTVAKASLPTTTIASIPPVVKTNTVDSTTTSKTTTSSTTTLSTPATPKAVVSVAKATAAESTMQSSVTQMSRSAVAQASTAGIVKAVTTVPVVSSVTTPLVSSTVSCNTPVAVVSPLITTTRPAATVTRASTGNVSTSLPQTITTSSAQLTTAMSRTVNDGAGLKADRSATPALISKVK